MYLPYICSSLPSYQCLIGFLNSDHQAETLSRALSCKGTCSTLRLNNARCHVDVCRWDFIAFPVVLRCVLYIYWDFVNVSIPYKQFITSAVMSNFVLQIKNLSGTLLFQMCMIRFSHELVSQSSFEKFLFIILKVNITYRKEKVNSKCILLFDLNPFLLT